MENEDIEQLTEFMLGDNVSKMLDMIHENKKLKKENELLKEELKELKDGIIGVYNNMNSLEIINKHELESDIEEIWKEK